MTTYSKHVLSGSTDGKGILVSGSASPGVIIHTAVSGTSDLDEIWLWANNTGAYDEDLTIEFGGTTDPDNLIEVSIPPKEGLTLVCPGLILQNELVISAFASSASVVIISGFVNRIGA